MANNKMLIDAAHPEETRVAMVRGNRIDEFDFESEHKTQLRGNIYLAKVTRVEPSLQAAFVDYGGNRHGFLAFSEIHPDYYQIPVADRQALIEAEAEDARAAAREEDDDEASSDLDAVSQQDEDDAPAKPARNKRSRRRGGKKAAEAAETNADDAEVASADDDVESPKTAATESPQDDDVALAADAEGEEDDDDADTIAAENDGDDVVSEPVETPEPVKKTRRKTSRKKKDEAKTNSTEGEAAPETEDSKAEAADSEGEAEKPAKKTRRRTSRKKKDAPEAEIEAEAESAPESSTDSTEEKPKKTRRRTSRKKKSEDTDTKAADTEVSTDGEADAASEEPDSETKPAEESGRKPRSRRSKRKSAKPADDNGDDGDTAVEDLGSEDALEEVPARRTSRRHYKIQEVIKRRQILLVQVVKEERGNKGAALTTYLSLAGRYSVLMPNTARGGGISRKITNAADRKRLKAVASSLEVPQGMGVILRTAGASRKPEDIQRDFEYLMRLWENVRTLTLESTAPCLVYEEGNLIKRSIRDLYDKDTGEILVAGEAGYREAKDFMTMLMPNHAKNVKLYKDRIPMFARMGVEAQLDAMLQPQVTLKSGGYLVINQTEALVAIDVNSGRSTRQHSIEETATQTNLEAADEVARQLRLRDLAGLIVIDFIDMEDKRNNRAVEKRLKEALKSDRARIQVGRISHFGLMEMSRQRIRASVLESTTQVCPTCEGLGHVRASSSVVLQVLRSIEEHLNRNSRNNLTVKVSSSTSIYMLNNKRETLSDLESRFGVALTIEVDDTLGTTPCTIERGEASRKKPALETAVQPDTIFQDEDEGAEQPDQKPDDGNEGNEGSGDGRKRRRRRRRKRGSGSDKDAGNGEANQATDDSASQEAQSIAEEGNASSETAPASDTEDPQPDAETEKKPRRRSRRTKAKADEAQPDAGEAQGEETDPADVADEKPKRRTSRSRKKKEEPVAEEVAAAAVPSQTTAEPADSAEPSKPKRRTTRRKSEPAEAAAEQHEETVSAVATAETEDATPEPTKRQGWWKRKFF